jgi:hypothetical protein
MIVTGRAILLMHLAAALVAQTPLDASGRLARARDILIERNKRLPDYTCLQTVDRRYFRPRHKHDHATPCDQGRPRNPNSLALESSDRLRLDLKVSQGEEIGSWPGSQFSSRSIFDLAGGAYGTGILGALISDTFVKGGAAYQYTGEQTSAGAHLSSFNYQVPAASSHYQVKTGSGWAPAAFAGAFWIDSDSLQLKRLTAQSKGLPPESGACEVSTDVDYQEVHAGTGSFLLPQQSSMHIVMQDGNETEFTAVYSGCREYHGEATIHFDEAPVEGQAKAGTTPAAPIPAGLSFSLALAEPIDTDSAAAGDLVKAKVRQPVRGAKSKTVLVPAGAAVEVRIVQMQHWLSDKPRFSIALLPEKVEVAGVWRPLYAKASPQRSLEVADVQHGNMVSQSGDTVVIIPPAGQSPLISAFLFPTDKNRYVVPAGHASDWETIAPPADDKK